MLLNYLRDLVQHTAGLGINALKITGTNGTVVVEGTDETNKSLVIKGSFLNPVTEFEGVCGLGDLEWLASYVNAYKHKDDVATVKRVDKEVEEPVVNDNGEAMKDEDGNPVTQRVTKSVVEEIRFSRGTQMKNDYRVMDLRLLDPQKKLAAIQWDVEFEPTQQAINFLATQAGLNIEKFFGVKVDDGTMYLTFGNTAVIEFATDVEGDITKAWTWEIKRVFDILKMASEAECTMSFSDRGVLKIALNTGLSEYNYILPARAGA